MKDKLIKWGFEEMHGSTPVKGFFILKNGTTEINVYTAEYSILSARMFVNGFDAPLPNCNNELALINLLYILGLLEV